MTKPRNDELRDAIVKQATAMFLRDGYDNVKLKDIAKECGITASLLQYYFPKRSDLVVQLSYSIIAQVHAFIYEECGERLANEFGDDADLGAVEVFYRTFYRILRADNDRLLKLYAVVLCDTPTLRAGTDMLWGNLATIIWPGRTQRSKAAAYAVNGILAQFVDIYLANAMVVDFDWYMDFALEAYYSMVRVSPELKARIDEVAADVMRSSEAESFTKRVLDALPI